MESSAALTGFHQFAWPSRTSSSPASERVTNNQHQVYHTSTCRSIHHQINNHPCLNLWLLQCPVLSWFRHQFHLQVQLWLLLPFHHLLAPGQLRRPLRVLLLQICILLMTPETPRRSVEVDGTIKVNFLFSFETFQIFFRNRHGIRTNGRTDY